MSGSTVEVPRGLLIALAAAAAAGVLAVTFLVGRESGRGPQPALAATVTLAVAEEAPPSAPSASAGAASLPAAPAIEGPPPASSPTAAPVDGSFPSVAPAAHETTRTHDTTRNEVLSYFREVETIQSQGKSWGDPQALAQTLLEQASKGDVSGFDGLAAANRKVRDAVRAVAVPDPCREHHRLTVALLDESIAMLDRVKGQLSGADAGSLAAMPAEGQALERKAKEVDAMAAEIKLRFGI